MTKPVKDVELNRLITKDRALERLFDNWIADRSSETITVAQAYGRVLAKPAISMYNIPIVRASAMDGVAIKYGSVKNGLQDTGAWVLGRDYVRADTGDDFSDEFDTVIKIEDVEILPNGGLRFAPDIKFEKGSCIKGCGSKIRQGELLAAAGVKLGALDICALISGGVTEVTVMKKPKIAFVPTGSELQEPGALLTRGQCHDSNSTMLRLLIEEMGGEAILHPIVRDDKEKLEAALEKLLKEADVVILGAGTSKGEEDYCHEILQRRGEHLFHGVAAVPGRPMSMAIVDNKPVINISGPSLAAFYSFDWALKPIICAFLGIEQPQREELEVVLTHPIKGGALFSALVRLHVFIADDGKYYATPMSAHGDTPAASMEMLTSNALYVTQRGDEAIPARQTIKVELLRTRETIKIE